jgi:hypothetical protein
MPDISFVAHPAGGGVWRVGESVFSTWEDAQDFFDTLLSDEEA